MVMGFGSWVGFKGETGRVSTLRKLGLLGAHRSCSLWNILCVIFTAAGLFFLIGSSTTVKRNYIKLQGIFVDNSRFHVLDYIGFGISTSKSCYFGSRDNALAKLCHIEPGIWKEHEASSKQDLPNICDKFNQELANNTINTRL
ncbi:hypothetical protein HAX54_051078 [Datura stramonium]|uniref:Uncharacterized protein n=1 Tax=Datura stramonium TaxID=4076 RepID=A0ABS8SXA2_DATST|nr:hypothetical protein [Datura stramonium]